MKHPELFKDGYFVTHFPLDERLQDLIKEQDWSRLDHRFRQLTSLGGALHEFLKTFHDFNSIEFIISIRDAKNEWEEDGIWHDDGSRVFSFSISLSSEVIEGGFLGVRRRGEENFAVVATPPYGGIILFLTGHYGFEHRIHQVTRGRRIIVAGWCT